ncbi:MAG: nuclear transport factor 2 family protein [Bacteroidota bacterium]
MKFLIFVFSIGLLMNCNNSKSYTTENTNKAQTSEIKTEIDSLITNWHKAASEANLNNYFDLMDSNSIYIGTDAKENWTKKEFKDFCEPYFEKGKTWNFKTLKRNIFVSKTAENVWFDEILKTQMGTCRGSGVLEKSDNGWKIKHYVLSVAIPNEDMDDVVNIKSEKDSVFLNNLKIDG